MLEIIKDDNGNIKAVCEWYLVDNEGNFAPKGDYVWINEIEVNPQFRNNGMLGTFIKIVTNKVPWAKYGYFHRLRKYPKRKPRIYSKKQWLRRTGEGK